MKRSYYTDPLAAAWMAKHFGMGFEYASQMGLSESVIIAHCPNGSLKSYIHPDSLPLLEPQDKDTGQDEGGDWFIYSSFYKAWQSIATPHDCEYEADGAVSIRQRNGIAFHWPEISNG